jgi:hypothetical protein
MGPTYFRVNGTTRFSPNGTTGRSRFWTLSEKAMLGLSSKNASLLSYSMFWQRLSKKG